MEQFFFLKKRIRKNFNEVNFGFLLKIELVTKMKEFKKNKFIECCKKFRNVTSLLIILLNKS